jgi:hypothetical protein
LPGGLYARTSDRSDVYVVDDAFLRALPSTVDELLAPAGGSAPPPGAEGMPSGMPPGVQVMPPGAGTPPPPGEGGPNG